MKENIFRGVIAAAVAGAAAYFQELALPVVVLFLVMVVDYVSGMVRAWTRGELCSRVGVLGINSWKFTLFEHEPQTILR